MNQVQAAEQQLYGYAHAKQGYSLIDLISAMGLTQEEWGRINKLCTGLNADEIDEIDDYFTKKIGVYLSPL